MGQYSTGAGWSYGRHYRCWLVIWKTLQMPAGHMEDITDAGRSFGRQYRCGLVMWKTLQMRAGHMEDITDAGWSFGRHYRSRSDKAADWSEAGWKGSNKSTEAGRSGWYRQYRQETSNYRVATVSVP